MGKLGGLRGGEVEQGVTIESEGGESFPPTWGTLKRGMRGKGGGSHHLKQGVFTVLRALLTGGEKDPRLRRGKRCEGKSSIGGVNSSA